MFNRKLSRGVSKVQVGAMLAMAVLGVTSLAPRAHAANVLLKDTNLGLSDTNAWVGLNAPGALDVAVLDNTLTGAVNSTFTWAVGAGSNNSFAGIQVLNPGGDIVISDATNPLTLGASGIDMSTATRNLTLNVGVVLGASQTWTVGSGLAMNVGGVVNMGGGDTTSTFGLTIAGPGNTNITGSLVQPNGNVGAALTKIGLGTLTMSSTNSYTGQTIVRGGGALVLDFSVPTAPASNIINSSSQLVTGGAGAGSSTVRFTGNPSAIVTQAFNGWQVQGGLTVIDSSSPGLGVNVNFGAITSSAIQNGAMIRFNDNVTAGVLTTTSSLGAALRNGNQGLYATFGLNDYAGVTNGGVITSASNILTYTVMGTGDFPTAPGGIPIDITGGSVNLNGNVQYFAFRIASPLANTINIFNNGQVGGFLMTPSAGAINVTVIGSNLRTLAANNANGVLNFWNNDPQGTLTIAASVGGSGTGYAYTKGGAGLVIFSTGTKGANSGMSIDEGELRMADAAQLGSTDGTNINILGGVLGISGSFANANGAVQHPIVIGAAGGGINVLTGNNFTITGSSNTAITGSGLLTMTGGGTLTLANTSNTSTGGLSINNGVVVVSGLGNNAVGTGPVNVNSAGTLTVTGSMSQPFTVNSGGTYLSNTGTVSGAITLLSGANVTGTGITIPAVVLPSGADIEPGSRSTLSTISFQNLTLQSGSILNMTMRGAPKGSDIVNILAGGTLNLTSSNLIVNMWDVLTGGSFFFNGSYQLFSGVDVITAGKYLGGNPTLGILTNLVAGNLVTSSGAAAVFSIVGSSTASSIWVTITGANAVSNWQAGGTSSGTDWMDPGSWSDGIPGKQPGDAANIAGTVTPTTIALNNGTKGQHLGVLALDAGTNSGWTIVGGTGKLFLDNGSNGAQIQASAGNNVVAANVDLLSPTTFSLNSSNGSLTISGLINGAATTSTVSITGTGGAPLILTAANTISGNGTIAANGTLQFGNGGATGAYGSGTLTDSGNLIIKRTGSYNLTALVGGLLGAGTLTQSSPGGQLIWNNTLTSGAFSGTVNIVGGTVTVGTGATWSSPILSVGTGGTFDLGGNNLTFSGLSSAGVITNAGAAPAILNYNSGSAATLGGTLTNGANTLSIIKSGTGALTINGTGSLTGHVIVRAGTVVVASSAAIGAGSGVDLAIEGLVLNDGVNLAAPIVVGAENSNLGGNWFTVAANSSATMSGAISAGTNSQMRWLNAAGTTITVTGVITTSSPDVFLNGANLIFAGATFNQYAAPIAFGRGGSSTVTLLGSVFNSTTSGMALDWLTNGATSTNVVVTVNNSTLNTGTASFDLNGAATSGTTLTLTNSRLVVGQFIRTSTGATTLFTIDNSTLVATQTTDTFIGNVANTTFGIGVGGATLDTAGFNLGIHNALSSRPGTNGGDGGLTILGAGQVTLYATGSNYTGATNFSNNLIAAADNVFSPNSALIFKSGTSVVTGGGFSESIGGIDDQASAIKSSATTFNTLTLSPGSGHVYKFDGTLSASNLVFSGSGTQILTNTAFNWNGSTTLGGNGLGGGKLVMGTAASNGFTVNSTSLSIAAGENTLEWWKGTAASAGLTVGSLALRQVGGVGNIVVADGTNGVTNFVKISGFTPGFIDQGTFFGGADYAYIDGTGGFFRAPVYGGADVGFLAADVLTSGNHVLVTGSDTLAGFSNFNTLKISGTGALNQAGNAITLNNSGILKGNGGAGSISGGTIVTGTNGSELIIRVDSTSDTLTIASSILDNSSASGGTLLTKSGAGSLILAGANTFAGKLNVLNGTIVVANASALQNALVSLLSTQNPIQFANGTGVAVVGGLLSPVGGNGTLTLQQNVSGNPVNLIIKTNDSALLPLSADGFSRFNTFSGLLAGTGSVTIVEGNSSIGRLDIGAANTFTGGFTLLSGRVQAAQAPLGANGLNQALGTGTVTLTGGSLGTYSGGTNSAFNNDFNFNGNAFLATGSLAGAAANATLNGNIFGSGTLTRLNTGTLVFNGSDNSNFTGTFINIAPNATTSSVVNVNNSAVPGASAWIFNNAATFEIFDTVSGVISLTQLAGTVSGVTLRITTNNTAVTANIALTIGAANVNNTFVGAITTTASNNAFVTLTKVGTGNLTLGGASNFSGGVLVTSGTLTPSFLDNGVLLATNAAAAAGATVLSLASTVGLVTNMVVAAAGVKPGTTITAISATGITLSSPTTAAIASGLVVLSENRNPLGTGGTISLANGTTLAFDDASTANGNSTVKSLAISGNVTLASLGTIPVTFVNPGSISYSAPGAASITLAGNNTGTNLLAAQIVNNGASAVGLVINGTGLWTLGHSQNTFSGGTTISSGQLMITNATGNALGTGAVAINSGGTLAGSGYATANINVNSGGHLGGGGTSINNHLGTINLGGVLTLATGSVLDFDMSLPGSPNDVINLFGASSSLVIPAVANAVSVNLYNTNITTNYFYNGTYNLFTGIPAANVTSINAALAAQALKAVNEPAGPSFVFSLASGDPTRLIVTIGGAWNNATWTNGLANGQWSDAGSNNWTGGVPNGSGNIANFLTNITTSQTVTLVGPKTVTNLTLNNTNSFNITGTDALILAAGSANGALITVSAGSHTISAPITISAAVLTFNDATNSILTIKNISGGGSLAVTGAGSLVITGSATPVVGTSIASGAKLVIGNGSTGTLSGLIDNNGNLIFNHTDNVNFAVSNLVQTSTGGTLTNAGTGILTLQGVPNGTASSALIPGPIVVNAGKVIFDTNLMTNGAGTGNMTVGSSGTLDLNGHIESASAFVNAGTVTSTGGAGTLFLSGTNANSTSSGLITGALTLIKDGPGSITISGGTVNNSSLTIANGQVIFTNTASTALSGLIIMGRTDTTSAGLILGAGVNVTTSALISVYSSPLQGTQPQGNVEFVGTQGNVTATFSGNVNVDTVNPNGQQLRIGNASATGTLVYAGTLTVPNNITGMVTRNNVTLAGNGQILDQNLFTTFNIGTGFDSVGASVNFNMTGSSQLLTSVADDNGSNNSIGLRLGNQGTVATATSTHTIAGNAFVRVGINGASVYDLQPSGITASTMSNTLNLNGGSIALARFYMQNGVNFGGGFGGPMSQVNINLNGGTVIAGLNNNDLTMGASTPFNMKFTVQTGGLILDLNGKTNVQWSKPLTSGALTGTTAAAFTDGGVKYVSSTTPSSITLSTRQLYAGPTTMGPGATVLAGSSDVLGNPAAAGAVNFAGGILKLTQSFVLASTDGGSTFLTHRFSFNDAGSLLDSVGGSSGQLNSNATLNGNGVLSMTTAAASASASQLNINDIGGASTNYTANGVSFAVWYTAGTQSSNAVLFSIGQNSPSGAGPQTGANPTNYFMLTVASGAATGNIRAMLNVGGGEISASSAQPATGSEHLAVVTIDGSNLAVFVDGVLTQRVALSTLGGGDMIQNLINGGGIYLGGSQFAADPAFNGSVNEFRVYNSVLNGNYVNAMYASGANTLAAAASLNRNLTVDTTGGTLDLAGFRLDVGGNMSGAGTLTLRPGTLALTGSSTANLIVANGAKLLVGTGGAGGALTAGNITNNDEIVFNRSDAAGVLGATITGGTVTFAGGTTTVSAPTLPQVNLNTGALMLASSVNVTGLFTVAGGAGLGFTLGTAPSVLALTGGYNHTGGAINVLAPGFGFGFDAGEYTVLTGAGTPLAGQFNTPAPANGYSYALDTSTSGSLAIIVTAAWFNQLYWRSANADASWTNNSNWSATSALDISNASGSPLAPTSVIFNTTNSALATLSAASFVHDLSFTGSGTAAIGGTPGLQIIGANAITVGAGAGAVTVNPAGGIFLAGNSTITNNGTAGLTLGLILGVSLTLAGVGLTTLTTANTFSVGVNIAGGTVKIANAGALGGNALTLSGTLDLNAQAVSVSTFSGASTGVLINSGTVAASLTTTIAGVSTYAGHLLNNVALTKNGSGTLVLSGTSSNLGATTINAGKLLVGANNALSANSLLSLAGTAVLDMSGFNATTGGLTGPATATITNSVAAASTLTVNSTTGASTTFSGVVQNGAGTLALIKTGAGRLDLGTANAFSGGVTLLAGTLSANNLTAGATTTSVGTGPLTLTGGLFRLQTTSSVDSVLANAIVANGNAQINTSGSANATFSGNISGSGILVKIGGSGIVSVTGTNNSSFHGTIFYDNSTNASLGNLTFIAPGAYPASDFNLTLNAPSAAIFNAAANAVAGIATLSGNNLGAAVNFSSGGNTISTTLSVGGSVDSTFLGAINSNAANTMSFVKTGSGRLTLGGTLTSAATTISAGALQIGNAGTTGSLGAAAVANAGTLIYNRTDAVTVANAITGAGGFTHAGTGTTTLSAYSATGPLNVNAGRLALGGSAQPPTRTTALTIAGTATAPTAALDLKDGGLIVTYTGSGTTQSSTMYSQIIVGKGGLDGSALFTYAGNGITSSTARASNVAKGLNLFAVGVLNNADLTAFGVNPQYSAARPFMGQAVASNTVLSRYTYAGDINLDGKINIDDYNYIDTAFASPTAYPGGWIAGDFNNDGKINIDDYNVIDTAFAFQGAPLGNGLTGLGDTSLVSLAAPSGGSAPVPEPASLALLALGAVGLLSRRKRRHH